MLAAPVPTGGNFRHLWADDRIRQGVTTVIGGPYGNSRYPIGEYLGRLETLPVVHRMFDICHLFGWPITHLI